MRAAPDWHKRPAPEPPATHPEPPTARHRPPTHCEHADGPNRSDPAPNRPPASPRHLPDRAVPPNPNDPPAQRSSSPPRAPQNAHVCRPRPDHARYAPSHRSLAAPAAIQPPLVPRASRHRHHRPQPRRKTSRRDWTHCRRSPSSSRRTSPRASTHHRHWSPPARRTSPRASTGHRHRRAAGGIRDRLRRPAPPTIARNRPRRFAFRRLPAPGGSSDHRARLQAGAAGPVQGRHHALALGLHLGEADGGGGGADVDARFADFDGAVGQ